MPLTVKAMNDTLGLHGVVPSTLVFDEQPPMFTSSELNNKRSTLNYRAKLAFEASKEMEQYMDKV